ncbi:hypothetical protein AAFF_G00104040 [Aldrovandia affinis]|uniref:Fibronectin type-III domain-containing protein n=1 Tax=Aldrovandia affinis TaxID=143900 RepID=A0AAD7RU59_9TELE|nr:hypothetical protein AAFF_G00104040 [Aldrovandia affinis]
MGSVSPLSPDTTYVVRIEAMNAGNVISTDEVEGLTAPEIPEIERTISKQSDSVTVEFSSVPGAIGYILRAEIIAEGFFKEIEVFESPATMDQLQPYTMYELSVMSFNSGGRSQPSWPLDQRTVLPAPVLSSESPNNETIEVNWEAIEHAVMYSLCLTMEGTDIEVKVNTNNTMMEFTNLEPGTNYTIKANAWDADSIPGDDVTIVQVTRPTTPDGVYVGIPWPGRTTGMEVTWYGVNGAESYYALSSNGQNCTTNIATYCIISPLECGENYTVTVTAINQAGSSDPSPPEEFLSFPCPPEMLWVDELVPGNITLHWREVKWAEYYTSFMKRDDGIEQWCNTTSIECNYQTDCGYTYFLSVFAYNQAGSSPPGPVVNYTAIPCCPDDVEIYLVSKETLEITWSPVRGAEMYQTKAAGNSELIHCNDTSPVCALSDLTCNTVYSVVVIPCCEHSGCNHTCRPHTQETAPCSPEIVNVTQTSGSSVKVSWTSSNREANYTVTLTGEKDMEFCHSMGTSCDFPSLPCGTTYDVVATARTSVGLSLPSYTVPLETAPCCPRNLTVRQVTQAMSHVVWSPATGAQSYITSLTSPRGEAKCHTMERQCLMGCITCSTNYTVSVEAISKTGHKSECAYHGFSSSVCCPTNVRLYRMSNNTIRVHWRSSGNLGNYNVDLQGTLANYTCSPPAGGNSCDVLNVVCGGIYTVVVAPVSQDGTEIDYCPKRMYSVVEPPVNATVTNTGRSTARLTWEPVNKVLLYEVTIADIDNPSSAPFVTNTSSTSLDISNLQPCSTYRIGVSSVNDFSVPGEATYVRYTTKTINAVSSISVVYSCSSGKVTVSWGTVVGAESYRATATDGNGTTLSCTTQSDSCPITRVTCGELYLVRVTAISEDCNSTSNITKNFETVPCPPRNLVVESKCSSNLIIVKWDPTNNTNYYVATALATTGEVTECRTTELYCHFTDTGCGQGYQYTVYSVSSLCNSASSPAIDVRTAPCNPTNVKTVVECQSDVLTITWDRSDGALSYFVEVQGNRGDRYNCTKFDNSCAVPAMQCGESLSVWITASNDNCNSGRVLGEVAKTGLCTPQNVMAKSECGSDHASLEWEASAGVVSYIATAVHPNGTVRTCTASDSQCQIQGLRCGQTYTASVVATNLKCNSTESANVTLETGQPAPSYFVEVQGNQGDRYNCTKSDNSCAVPAMQCGESLSVWITARNDNCNSGRVLWEVAATVPCTPQNVTAISGCGSDHASLDWEASAGAVSYIATAVHPNGTVRTCTANDSQCQIQGLRCGQTYTASVVATNLKCNSTESANVTLETVPCPPEMWVDELGPGNITLHWREVKWAEYYTSFMKRDDGIEQLCNTTSIEWNYQTDCGYTYFLSVFAHNQACSSPPGPEVNYTTTPCCPDDVKINLVSNETLEIKWSPVRGAEVYQTKATGNSKLILCNDTSPVCVLSDLTCNTVYSVVVIPCCEHSGCNHNCRSHTQETAPCSPEIVNVTQTSESSVKVSWTSSNREANYTVTLMGEKDMEFCHSMGTSCDFTSLPCGTTYDVVATARTSVGLSLPSYTVPLETAPCCPRNLTVRQVTQAMSHVVWSPATGAQSYITSLTSPRGKAKCHTMETECLMGCITCSTNYTVSVEAISKTGHKSECTYHGFSSSVCCPTNVRLYRMSNNTIRVHWCSSGNLGNYTVDLQGTLANYTCSPPAGGNSCDVLNVVCGGIYTVVVAPVSQDGTEIDYCPKRMYSVYCVGSNIGKVIHRGKRSVD